MEVEEEDRYDTWVGDAESAQERKMIATARAILAYSMPCASSPIARIFGGKLLTSRKLMALGTSLYTFLHQEKPKWLIPTICG